MTQKTTHLICSEATGPKYEAAKNWKIPSVTYDWVVSSINARYALPEKNFVVGKNIFDDDDPFADDLMRLEESKPIAQSTQILSSGPVATEAMDPIEDVPSLSQNRRNLSQLTQTLDKCQIVQKRLSQSFQHLLGKKSTLLDNCEVFMTGFGPEDYSFCKSLIKSAEGYVTRQINDRTMFVIIGSETKDEELLKIKKEIKDQNFECHVVRREWLLDSICTGRLYEPQDYPALVRPTLKFSKQEDNQPSLGFRIIKRNSQSQKQKNPERVSQTYSRPNDSMMISDEDLLRSYRETPKEADVSEMNVDQYMSAWDVGDKSNPKIQSSCPPRAEPPQKVPEAAPLIPSTAPPVVRISPEIPNTASALHDSKHVVTRFGGSKDCEQFWSSQAPGSKTPKRSRRNPIIDSITSPEQFKRSVLGLMINDSDKQHLRATIAIQKPEQLVAREPEPRPSTSIVNSSYVFMDEEPEPEAVPDPTPPPRPVPTKKSTAPAKKRKRGKRSS